MAITNMKWACREPGYWIGSDGTNTATTHRVREGSLYSSDWMWIVKINDVHIANEETLASSKKFVAKHVSDFTACT